MAKAVAMLEFNSVGHGIAASDAVVKAAQVTLLAARPICPGKYISLFGGDVGAVKAALAAGLAAGGGSVVGQMLLANVHESIFPAITCTAGPVKLEALGVIETFSVATLIEAADAAAKAAAVQLIEIRLGVALGGKGFVTLTGPVSNVKAAVEAGSARAREGGVLVSQIVIPAPSPDLNMFIQ